MNSSTAPEINVSILDGLTLRDHSGSSIQIKSIKAQALLFFLFLHPKKTESRERLAGLLWSEKSEERARASLRQAIRSLRSTFDKSNVHGFHSDNRCVSVERLAACIDMIDEMAMLEQMHVGHTFTQVLDVPSLLGFGLDRVDKSFGSWLQVTRQGYRDRISSFLRSILNFQGAIDPMEKKNAAQALYNLDRSNEDAVRFLIVDHVKNGSPGTAVRLYNELWELLDEEFDTEPERETQELIAKVKLGELPTEVKSTQNLHKEVEPATSFPVLNVLPFRAAVIGEHELADTIAMGFRQDLIGSLVRFRDWIVVDGTMNQPPHARMTRSPSASDHEIDGTYFVVDDKVHLSVTIKKSKTGRFVWSERMTLEHKNWFTSLRKYTAIISANLNVRLSNRDIADHISDHNIPVDAYRAWMQGYRMIWSWNATVRSKAESIFKEVIEAQPTFAPAYSSLASIYNTEQMIFPGTMARSQKLEKAYTLAQKSVELDQLDVRNQVALAWSNGMTGRYETAAAHHKMAYELNTNNLTTAISSANGLAMCGDVETAKSINDACLVHSPLIGRPLWGYLASTWFVCGEYENCIEAAKIAENPIPVTLGWQAAAIGLTGEDETAKVGGRELINLLRPLWRGEQQFTRRAIVEWFVNHCPVKDNSVLQQAETGLLRACSDLE